MRPPRLLETAPARPPRCNALPRPRRGGAALHPHARFFFVQRGFPPGQARAPRGSPPAASASRRAEGEYAPAPRRSPARASRRRVAPQPRESAGSGARRSAPSFCRAGAGGRHRRRRVRRAGAGRALTPRRRTGTPAAHRGASSGCRQRVAQAARGPSGPGHVGQVLRQGSAKAAPSTMRAGSLQIILTRVLVGNQPHPRSRRPGILERGTGGPARARVLLNGGSVDQVRQGAGRACAREVARGAEQRRRRHGAVKALAGVVAGSVGSHRRQGAARQGTVSAGSAWRVSLRRDRRAVSHGKAVLQTRHHPPANPPYPPVQRQPRRSPPRRRLAPGASPRRSTVKPYSCTAVGCKPAVVARPTRQRPVQPSRGGAWRAGCPSRARARTARLAAHRPVVRFRHRDDVLDVAVGETLGVPSGAPHTPEPFGNLALRFAGTSVPVVAPAAPPLGRATAPHCRRGILVMPPPAPPCVSMSYVSMSYCYRRRGRALALTFHLAQLPPSLAVLPGWGITSAAANSSSTNTTTPAVHAKATGKLTARPPGPPGQGGHSVASLSRRLRRRAFHRSLSAGTHHGNCPGHLRRSRDSPGQSATAQCRAPACGHLLGWRHQARLAATLRSRLPGLGVGFRSELHDAARRGRPPAS